MNKMIDALTHLRDHLADRKPIPPDAGRSLGVARWGVELETVGGGTSRNHGLIRHTLGMLRGEEASLTYLHDRVRWELDNGLGADEQCSPSYNIFHLGCWLIVASKSPVKFLRDQARTWVERALAVTACTSRLHPSGELEILTPGDRSDSGGLHNEEAVMVAKILGLRGPESWGTIRAGLMLEAVGALDLGGVLSEGAAAHCRMIIRSKADPIIKVWDAIEAARLMTPMHYRVYGPDSWAAWIERGRHPQDPAWMATVVDEGKVGTMDLASTKPAEGGWKSECGISLVTLRRLEAEWSQRGGKTHRRKIEMPLTPHLRSLTIGSATDAPAPPEPEEPRETGWPPAPLGPHDPDSHLAKLAAHAQALADGEPGPHLAEARNNLEAWSLRNN